MYIFYSFQGNEIRCFSTNTELFQSVNRECKPSKLCNTIHEDKTRVIESQCLAAKLSTMAYLTDNATKQEQKSSFNILQQHGKEQPDDLTVFRADAGMC